MRNILVLCVGNICRSPVGERLLRQHLTSEFNVSSAGIGALSGHSADDEMAAVARSNGLSLSAHLARQFEAELGKEADLILVMETGHKQDITRRHPELSGKILLYDHWTGGETIPDPYKKSRVHHEVAYEMLKRAAVAWSQKLMS